MRWFKHISVARRDEKIAAYLDDCKRPLEAYGFWWSLVEIIAEKLDPKTRKCSVTYSLTRWSRELYCHHHSVGNYMGKLESNGLVTIVREDSKITVTVSNLLKYLDEYTNKSGQRSGQNQEQETDTDTEAETKNNDPDGSSGDGKPSPPECPHEEIINLYHKILISNPKVREWTKERQKFLRARWREKPERQKLDWWKKYFEYISESKFLTGNAEPQSGRKTFIADLEWIVRPSNFVKIIEGKYHEAAA